MKLLREGNPLVRAAVRAGMSEPTVRKYAPLGAMPSALKPPRPADRYDPQSRSAVRTRPSAQLGYLSLVIRRLRLR